MLKKDAQAQLDEVLIETLWNVNSGVGKDWRRERWGFNRNIVECKCIFEGIHYIVSNCFNRNIVECKFRTL